MKKAATIIGSAALCASCTSNREGYFVRSTGLDRCVLQGATFVPGDTPDMTRIRFRPQPTCKDQMMKSIEVAAGDACSTSVSDKKGCYYNFRGYSVVIDPVDADGLYVVSVYK